MLRIVIAAGELSGDHLGGSLIGALRAAYPDIHIAGIAGPSMRAAGCESWFQVEQLSVMGLAEIIHDLPRLYRLRRTFIHQVLATKPDVFIGIDSPDFNLAVHRQAHAAGIRTVQYVSPSVWAWRRGRVKTLREACSEVLCLLPFEVPFLQEQGVAAVFVGHPLADEIPVRVDRAAARRHFGLGPGPVVAILPGSRTTEVERLGPPFVRTAQWLSEKRAGIQFLAPMVSAPLAERFAALSARYAPLCRVQIVLGQAQQAMIASDVVLVASGTATLESMLLHRPMVVAYRLAALTYALARGLRLVKIAHISLPNLLARERLVPEFLQGDVRADVLGPEVQKFLNSKDLIDNISSKFSELHESLRCSAAARAARSILEVAARSG